MPDVSRRTLLVTVAATTAGCADATSGPDARAAETHVRERINELRAERGVGALSSTPPLVEAARDHCRDMHAREFYAHENPDGEQPWDRAPCRAGETIHRGELGRMQNVDGETVWHTSDTADLAGYVAEGWRLSDGHREVMLDPTYGAVGVGIVIEDRAFFATALFCR